MSQNILDLGLWDLTLPPQLGHPGLSQDVSQGILDLTLPCLPSWDILGCPGMSQDILDVRDSSWQSWTTLKVWWEEDY